MVEGVSDVHTWLPYVLRKPGTLPCVGYVGSIVSTSVIAFNCLKKRRWDQILLHPHVSV